MLNKIFDEFNDLYEMERKPINHKQDKLISLATEELNELSAEIGQDPKNFTKEAIDLIYVTCQQLRERGVDLDASLNEVHRSNMSKQLPIESTTDLLNTELDIARKRYPNAELHCGVGGYVIKCSDSGKLIKPASYSQAVITEEMINAR